MNRIYEMLKSQVNLLDLCFYVRYIRHGFDPLLCSIRPFFFHFPWFSGSLSSRFFYQEIRTIALMQHYRKLSNWLKNNIWNMKLFSMYFFFAFNPHLIWPMLIFLYVSFWEFFITIFSLLLFLFLFPVDLYILDDHRHKLNDMKCSVRFESIVIIWWKWW